MEETTPRRPFPHTSSIIMIYLFSPFFLPADKIDSDNFYIWNKNPTDDDPPRYCDKNLNVLQNDQNMVDSSDVPPSFAEYDVF